MDRRERIRAIERAIGRRKLVWFGTRGQDAAPLLSIGQFSECFSLIAPLGSLAVHEVCLETISGRRVDLDNYTPDLDESREAGELHQLIYEAVGEPSVAVVYRPTAFFASVCFPRSSTLEYLGLFHERQAAFEHKPWVETMLRKAGVPVLPWEYYGDDDRVRLVERFGRGPQVVRTTRSDGGAGLRIVRDPAELEANWPAHHDRFVAATDFLEPSIPLNVNAVVFPDGAVSLHGPSLQLIGVEGLTSLALGYCGNDFARIKDQDPQTVLQLEAIATDVGRWLARSGYVGAFGVDALWSDGTVFLTEINPRFQGSSSLSAELDHRLDRSDMYLENLAAFLGLDPPPPLALSDLVADQPALAHVVPHNLCPEDARVTGFNELDDGLLRWELVPDKAVSVQSGAVLVRAVVEDALTENGYQIRQEVGLAVLRHCENAYTWQADMGGSDVQ
jgi:hypothetical protein